MQNVDISPNTLNHLIYSIRGNNVMFDNDLARIYNVETRILKRAVSNNIERFPSDFMFKPTKDEIEGLRSKFWISKSSDQLPGHETESLRCQIRISNSEEGRGGNRFTPFVFTELGVSMLSSVLRSERAIQINIEIIRVFIQLRKQIANPPTDLRPRVESLERQFAQLQSHFQTQHTLQDDHPVRAIQLAVSKYFDVSVEALKSQARGSAVSFARQTAMFLIRTHLCLAFKEIGSHFGERDHSTAMYAYRKIRLGSDHSAMIRHAITSIQKELMPRLPALA